MQTFNYKAIDKNGKDKSGVLQAENAKQARQKLREMGLVVSHIESEKERKANTSRNVSFRKKAISSLELSLITRQLSILLNSGMSVEQSLAALADQLESQEQKSIMNGVRSEVLSGRPLAASLAMYPNVFPPVYCSLINAGEQSGSLASVMNKLADYSDKTRDLTSKIMMALLYPVIVSIVATMVIVALLVFVVPQVVKVFEASKQTLPLITRGMIATSNGLRSYGIYMLIIIILAIIGFARSLKKTENKINFHRRLLSLPIAGKLLTNIDIARFTNTLSMLLVSGVPMLHALEASKNTLSNFMLKTAIDKAITMVREGVGLAVALNTQKAFPPVVIHLIASGEKSGNLEHLLSQAGSHQELELSHRSQLLTGILEPALIVFMGAVVMLIVIGIMLPILNMNKMVM
ncbi:MAG: type II secretion system protein GspF [Proteobacteria bacterium]|nr:MAG: type II secretion system protein GspF [Pseudomonadota bacterium]